MTVSECCHFGPICTTGAPGMPVADDPLPQGLDGEPRAVDADGHLDRGVTGLLLDVDGETPAPISSERKVWRRLCGVKCPGGPRGLEGSFHRTTDALRAF
jgi:hypothetical protein